MIQKVIQVGNSLAVVLPSQFVKEAKFKPGDEVKVHTDAQLQAVYITPKTSKTSGLTPEFKEWLDDVCKKEADTIKALAKV